MTRRARGGAAIVLLLAGVFALWPRAAGAQQEVEVWHVELSSAASSLSTHQTEAAIDARFGGVTPARLRLRGAARLRGGLHLDAALLGERFTSTGPTFTGGTQTVRLGSSAGHLGLHGRWPLAETGLTFGAGGGYELGSVPLLDTSLGIVRSGSLGYHGLRLDAFAQYRAPLGIMLRAGFDWLPRSFREVDRPGGEVRLWRYAARAQVEAGRFRAGSVFLSPVADYTLERVGGVGTVAYASTAHRFGLGLRVGSYQALTPVPVIPPPPTRGRLLGRVTLPDGAPAAGATVVVGDRTVTADAQGGFALEELVPGRVEVVATLEGFLATTAAAQIVAGEQARLTLAVAEPTGPGIVSGVVRLLDGAEGAPGSPAAGAKVKAGKVEVVAGPDGAFRLEEVGPGLVSLDVRLAGHKPLAEVVSVPAGRTVEVALGLERVAARSPASLRGVIRLERGRAEGATVEVVEVGKRVRVGRDGRFHIQLAGGTYTVLIEAGGHIAQRRVVRLADGEHAIFHVELKPQAR